MLVNDDLCHPVVRLGARAGKRHVRNSERARCPAARRDERGILPSDAGLAGVGGVVPRAARKPGSPKSDMTSQRRHLLYHSARGNVSGSS